MSVPMTNSLEQGYLVFFDRDRSLPVKLPEGFLVACLAHTEHLVNVIGRALVSQRGDTVVLSQVIDDSIAQVVPG